MSISANVLFYFKYLMRLDSLLQNLNLLNFSNTFGRYMECLSRLQTYITKVINELKLNATSKLIRYDILPSVEYYGFLQILFSRKFD